MDERRIAAVAERVAERVTARSRQSDFRIEELDYCILAEIQRAAAEWAAVYPAKCELFYDLATAATKLRREVYPKPGAIVCPPYIPDGTELCPVGLVNEQNRGNFGL